MHSAKTHFDAFSSPRLNLGVVLYFPLPMLAGEVEGKRTERNVKMTSIMHIGFYRSRATRASAPS